MQKNLKKQFKARVENPWPMCHAMELHLEGNSIMSVGNDLLEHLGSLGVDESQITKLIEVEDRDR